jgi:hypothetical protein
VQQRVLRKAHNSTEARSGSQGLGKAVSFRCLRVDL